MSRSFRYTLKISIPMRDYERAGCESIVIYSNVMIPKHALRELRDEIPGVEVSTSNNRHRLRISLFDGDWMRFKPYVLEVLVKAPSNSGAWNPNGFPARIVEKQRYSESVVTDIPVVKSWGGR